MSTGLTWVSFYDTNDTVAPVGGGSVVQFSDYSEAVKFAIYNAKVINNQIYGSSTIFYIVIYTQSPNLNGYVVPAASPEFVAYE